MGVGLYGKGAEGLSWDKTSRAIHLREDMFPDACHVPRPDTFQAASLPQNYLVNFDLTRGFDSHHPLQFINWIWWSTKHPKKAQILLSKLNRVDFFLEPSLIGSYNQILFMKKIVQSILPAFLLVFAGLHSVGCSKAEDIPDPPEASEVEAEGEGETPDGPQGPEPAPEADSEE